MANTKTEKIINGLKSEILKLASPKLAEIKDGTKDVAIAWKKMQDVAADEIINLLTIHLPHSKITSPVAKSTYPDYNPQNQKYTYPKRKVRVW